MKLHFFAPAALGCLLALSACQPVQPAAAPAADASASQPVTIESVWEMVGIGTEGPALIGDSAVSENADLYLVEAIAPRTPRKPGTARQRKARS